MAANFDPLDVLGKGPPPADVPPRRMPVRSAPLAGEADENELAVYLRALLSEVRDARKDLAAVKESTKRIAFYAAVIGLPILAVLLFWVFAAFVGLGQGMQGRG